MAISTPQTTIRPDDRSSSYRGPLAMVTTLFFMWGFLTCLNDILVPHLKLIFDLSYVRDHAHPVRVFLSVFCFSLPMGKLVPKRLAGKQVDAWSPVCSRWALAALLFIPAAKPCLLIRFFSAALIVLAAGIDSRCKFLPILTSSVLGPARTASSRLNLAQAFNSLGNDHRTVPWRASSF